MTDFKENIMAAFQAVYRIGIGDDPENFGLKHFYRIRKRYWIKTKQNSMTFSFETNGNLATNELECSICLLRHRDNSRDM